MKKKGRFFAFEGIDGSGKSTQVKLLLRRFRDEGLNVQTLEIPQYGKKSAGLVEEYLLGTYGSLHDVGPYEASVFYAVDRYDAAFQIRQWLTEDSTILLDRYVGSNMGHQGAKIKSAGERRKFFQWLYKLEYEIFNIPKPTISIFLDVAAPTARKLAEDPERRKRKKKDIHEANAAHFRNAEVAYLHAIKTFPKDFARVSCIERGKLLPEDEIHERIWKIVAKHLY